MAKVITLARRSGHTWKGGKKCKVKEVLKAGYFNVKEFANWVTGFKSDEVAQSSELPVDIHRAKPATNKRYF